MSNDIQIGICTTPERVIEIAEGYDFIELGVASTLMPLEGDEVFAAMKPRLAALHPPIQAFNVFVAPQVKLVGSEVDYNQVNLYVQRALRRANALGGKVVVFGSGGARAIPPGFNRTEAWGQLIRFLEM